MFLTRIGTISAASEDRSPTDDFWFQPVSRRSMSGAIVTADSAMRLSAVWRAINLISGHIAMLPLELRKAGTRKRVAEHPVYALFRRPNPWQNGFEWRQMLTGHLLLRGNAYARIDRSPNGEAYALWPMSADQVEMVVQSDGTVTYYYRIGSDLAVLAEANVLHFKGLGNGTIGLSRLDYMRATVDEVANGQTAANRLFANGGKPTGVLMVDQVLNKDQRDRIKANFEELASGSTSRLFVLEANMKYQQVNMSPNDMQLLTTRQFGVEEICRWFGVPPVMVGHANVTTWGSGVEQILDGFYKTVIGPALVNLGQAVRKRVMTPAQRVRYSAEFSADALLRANLKDRSEIYSKMVQNGLKTRNECRQLENDPPIPGGDELTAQINLAPLALLGKMKPTGDSNGTQDPLSQ